MGGCSLPPLWTAREYRCCQAGWGLAGLGICTSWALSSALPGVGVGWSSAVCRPLPGRTLVPLPTLWRLILTCLPSWCPQVPRTLKAPLPNLHRGRPSEAVGVRSSAAVPVMTKWTLCSENKAASPALASPHSHTQEYSPSPTQAHLLSPLNIAQVWRWVGHTGVTFSG